MIRYLLDTNVLVDVLRNKRAEARTRIQKMGIDNCAVSDLTVYELYTGVAASAHPEANKELVQKMFDKLAVIPVSDGYWKAACEKARLAKEGNPIEDFDILIGCTALEYGLTLVTTNVKHMERIQGLKVEKWLSLL